jgi:hypothetical protein
MSSILLTAPFPESAPLLLFRKISKFPNELNPTSEIYLRVMPGVTGSESALHDPAPVDSRSIHSRAEQLVRTAGAFG